MRVSEIFVCDCSHGHGGRLRDFPRDKRPPLFAGTPLPPSLLHQQEREILISDFMILLECVCVQPRNLFAALPRDLAKAVRWSRSPGG